MKQYFIIKDKNNQIIPLDVLDKEICKLWNQEYDPKYYVAPLQTIIYYNKIKNDFANEFEKADFIISNNWYIKFNNIFKSLDYYNNPADIINFMCNPYLFYKNKLIYLPNFYDNFYDNLKPYIEIIEYWVSKEYTINKI